MGCARHKAGQWSSLLPPDGALTKHKAAARSGAIKSPRSSLISGITRCEAIAPSSMTPLQMNNPPPHAHLRTVLGILKRLLQAVDLRAPALVLHQRRLQGLLQAHHLQLQLQQLARIQHNLALAWRAGDWRREGDHLVSLALPVQTWARCTDRLHTIRY